MNIRKIVGWVLAAGIAFIVIDSLQKQGNDSYSAASKARQPAVTAVKSEPTAQDRENGLALVIAKKLKAAMNNPDSFKLQTVMVFDGGSTCFEYRATNAFNAVMPGKAVFDATAEKILSHTDKGFTKTWNRICTKSNGRDITAAVNMFGRL